MLVHDAVALNCTAGPTTRDEKPMHALWRHEVFLTPYFFDWITDFYMG